jgi:hypothetical protein
LAASYRSMANTRIGWRKKTMTLPRLGSWVRIPSPAPKFFTIDIELRETPRSACCFPTSPIKAGEAWGKRRKANVALLPRTIGGVAMYRCTEPLSSCVRSTTTGLKLSHRIERPVHLFSQGPPTHRHNLTTPALPSNDSFNDSAPPTVTRPAAGQRERRPHWQGSTRPPPNRLRRLTKSSCRRTSRWCPTGTRKLATDLDMTTMQHSLCQALNDLFEKQCSSAPSARR